jgi:hypothetical protein
MVDSSDTEFGETIGDERERTPFEMLREKDLHAQIGSALNLLTGREQMIINTRFGLVDSNRERSTRLAMNSASHANACANYKVPHSLNYATWSRRGTRVERSVTLCCIGARLVPTVCGREAGVVR